MDIGFSTDRGCKRINNEDAFFVMKKDRLFAVADGVGGNRSGEIASRRAVSEVAKLVEEEGLIKEPIRTFFCRAVAKANEGVYTSSHRFRQNKGMATTLVLCHLRGPRLYAANVGDSRAYVFSAGHLHQITEDHTYVNELVKAGVLTSAEAKAHEDKNMITKAVGVERDLEPDYYEYPLQSDDIVMLCTDGLYGEVEEAEIAALLSQGKTMSATCQDLIEKAKANGGGDNITLVLIKVTEEDINE